MLCKFKLFFKTELSKLIAKMYKSLSPEKQEKYSKLAELNKEEYERKIEAFYQAHPEMKLIDKAHGKGANETGPKKPMTPFGLFYVSQLKTIDTSNIDKNLFKEACKEQWKNLSDKNKVIWINWAEEQENKYREELKKLKMQNPKFNAPEVKSVLTKDEKLLKERMAGKPVKPPTSVYSLFSQVMLQSEEIKNVQPQQRMTYIANNWRNCSDEDKRIYRERLQHLSEQYKLNFANYLETLPEDKRQEELLSIQPKRKAKNADAEVAVKKIKTKEEIDHFERDEPSPKKKKKKIIKEEIIDVPEETEPQHYAPHTQREGDSGSELDDEELFRNEPKTPPK